MDKGQFQFVTRDNFDLLHGTILICHMGQFRFVTWDNSDGSNFIYRKGRKDLRKGRKDLKSIFPLRTLRKLLANFAVK